MKTLNDLFVHFLRDIYYAEKQALKEMRGMSRKASSPQLKALLDEHREETEGQVEMLEQVFDGLGLRARGVKCEAIDGIVSEAHEIMEEAEDERTRDCGIVAAAQAVEHYEITRYGTLIAWARALGHDGVIAHLEAILEQEKAADAKLSELAVATLNPAAEGGDVADQEGGVDPSDLEDDADEVDDEELDDEGKAAKAKLLAMDEELEDAGAEAEADEDDDGEGGAAKPKAGAGAPKKRAGGARGRKAA